MYIYRCEGIAKIVAYAMFAANLCFALLSILSYSSAHKSAERVYTYIGDDYPLELVLPGLENVAMMFQESVRYSLNDSDPMGALDWKTIVENTRAVGRVWLGPERRMMVAGFYHEFHCLALIQDGFHHFSIAKKAHIVHCLQYLRQCFLCDADDTLEDGDFMLRDFEHQRMGDTAVCKDWEATFSWFDDNAVNASHWLKEMLRG